MQNEIEVDPVFLGLTRPAMFLGVTQNYFVINAVVSMIGFLGSASFYLLLLVAPCLHLLGVFACAHDPRTFDIWFTKLKFMKCRNRFYWRANSYDPFK